MTGNGERLEAPTIDLPRPVATYHSKTYPRILAENTGFKGDGKTVFITGGATGVGLATAKSFGKAGVARLVLVSRSPGPLKEAKTDLESLYPKTQVLTYSASITDADRISEILQEVQSIDILVLSAAAAHPPVLTAQLPTSQLQDNFKTNVTAQFDLTKAFLALPAPKSGSKKTVLNVSTVAAQMTFPGLAAYGSSKAAFTQIIQHFHSQQTALPEDERVRFFNYHPGSFYTDLGKKNNIPDVYQWEDINLPADFAVWLAGPESDFLQGRFLYPHWDVDELLQLKEKVAKDPQFLTIGLIQ